MPGFLHKIKECKAKLRNEEQGVVTVLNQRVKLIVVLLIVWVSNLLAQNKSMIKFNHLGKNNIISKVKIFAIEKDDHGFLWLATDEGLMKFDGLHVKNLKKNIRDTNTFKSNNIKDVLKDKNGKLWIAADGIGLYEFDPITESKKLYANAYKPKATNRIWNIAESPDGGELYLSTYGGGVNIFNKKTKQFKTITSYDSIKNGLPNNDIISVTFDKKGIAWICTRHNWLSKYDPKTGEFKNFHNFNNDKGTHFISGIGLYNEETIYMSTTDGLFEFSTITEKFKRYVYNKADTTSISAPVIEKIFISKNKTIYLSMNDGSLNIMDHFTKKCQRYKSNSNDPYSISASILIASYYEDEQGLIWLGMDKAGLDVIIPGAFKYQNWAHDNKNINSMVSNEIHVIQEEADHKIWMGTYGGGASCFDPGQQTFKNLIRNDKDKAALSDGLVYGFHNSNNGFMWLCTEDGLNKVDVNTFKVVKKYFTKADAEKNPLYKRMNRTSRIWEDKKGNFWVTMIGGGLAYFNPNTEELTRYKAIENDPSTISDNRIFDMAYDSINNLLWLAAYQGGLTAFDLQTKKALRFKHNYSDVNSMSSNWCFKVTIDPKTNMLWIGTETGLNGLDLKKYKNNKALCFFHLTKNEGLLDDELSAICADGKGNLWLSSSRSMYHYSPPESLGGTANGAVHPNGILKMYNEANGLPFNAVSANCIMYSKFRNRIYIGSSSLCSFNPDSVSENKIMPKVYITEIDLFNTPIFADTVIYQNKSLNLKYYENSLRFSFSVPSLIFPENNQVAYKLKGYDKDWIYNNDKTDINYTNLDPGVYEFKVKAANNDGYWNEEGASIFININPPFWKTTWFRVCAILSIVLLIWFFIRWREKKLKQEKEILEITVKERTAEVVEQKVLIEEKHKEITDSINYAERIQRSFLATKELLDENLKDYFVFFHPKDVVSGDFYWAAKLSSPKGGDRFALVTADSTGHGVPGAIMSILNISSLEKSIETNTEPGEILNATRKIIIDRLKKDGSAEGGKDGMDASLIVFNKEKTKLVYAAANNPIWVVRQNEIIELSSDKMPVGKHDKDNVTFTQHEFALQKNDVVYSLTDGWPDQFGGPKGKKFMYKQLKQLLISISSEPMQTQKQKLTHVFDSWKGNLEQIDDVTLIGVRV